MTNENFELENMRQQLNTLKKKLDQQEIVNDRLIRHSMEKTANKINRRYYFIMATRSTAGITSSWPSVC